MSKNTPQTLEEIEAIVEKSPYSSNIHRDDCGESVYFTMTDPESEGNISRCSAIPVGDDRISLTTYDHATNVMLTFLNNGDGYESFALSIDIFFG